MKLSIGEKELILEALIKARKKARKNGRDLKADNIDSIIEKVEAEPTEDTKS